MLRRILAALLLTALLAMPALADGTADDRQARRQEFAAHWQNLTAAQRERGLDRAEAHGLFARFSYSNGTGMADGRFLHFHVQASTGAIHDVRVRANRTLALVPLFAGVTPDHFTLQAGPTVHGAMLALDGTPVDLMAHNNPTAGLTWRADGNVSLTFALASGLHALFPNPQDRHEVRIPVGATHAHIVSDAAAPILLSNGNTTVTVALGAGDAAMVRVHPVGDSAGSGLHDLIAAFKAHKLGASLRAADADGAAAEDGEGADVNANTRSIARGHVVWDIDSAQHAGRVLFLTLDNDTVDLAHLTQVTVTLNGTGLRHAGTAAEVVAASDGAFALVPSADGQSVTVAVNVPHFSSYALALAQPVASGTTAGSATTASGATTGSASQATSGTSRGTPGLEAGALLALGLAVALRRRA